MTRRYTNAEKITAVHWREKLFGKHIAQLAKDGELVLQKMPSPYTS